MKWFVAVAAFGIVASSQASFDLLLTPDAAGGIRRIDPQTGAMLGKFGGTANYRLIEASQSTGRALAFESDTGRFYGYNYSTGERTANSLRTYTGVKPEWSSLAADGDTVVLGRHSLTTIADRFSLSSSSFIGGTTISTTIGGVYAERGSFGILTDDYTSSLNLTARGVTSAGVVVGSVVDAGHCQFMGGPIYIDGPSPCWVQPAALGSGSPSVVLVKWGVNATTGAITSFGLQSMLGMYGTASSIFSVVRSHNGFYVIGRDAVSPSTLTRIREFDNLGSPTTHYTQLNDYTLPFESPLELFKPGIVLAPEPGTWAALGLGALALMRRKRSS